MNKLRTVAVESRNNLLERYYGLHPNDPRIATARHLKAVVSSNFLNLVNLERNLRFREWWEQNGFGVAVEKGLVQDEIEGYATLINATALNFSFGLFEAGLRRLTRPLLTAGEREANMVRELIVLNEDIMMSNSARILPPM